jgi:UDP-3-O-[3-hydroxymyristoyl] N-acetylglucosamine deacetylase
MLRDAAAYTIEDLTCTQSSKQLSVQGYGLHSGSLNTLSLEKVKGQSWIEFVTEAQGHNFHAPAQWTRLSGTTRSTALVLRGDSKLRFELRTIEHFMAAAFVYDLQGYHVKIQSDHMEHGILEVPILDGSSKEWTCLKVCQSEAVPSVRPVWLAAKDFVLEDGSKKVVIEKSTSNIHSHYHCDVDFGPAWKQQKSFSLNWLDPVAGREDFERNIAPARTFGFKHELDELVRRGLIKGASLENALLLDDNKVVNTNGFRVPEELAAHKLLDAVGDFALLGKPLIGTLRLVQAGHYLHLRALDEAVRQGALRPALLKSTGELFVDSSADDLSES